MVVYVIAVNNRNLPDIHYLKWIGRRKMEKLLKLIEDSALRIVTLEGTDLPVLAEIHSCFENIAARAGKIEAEPAEFMQNIASVSEATVSLIGKIILDELSDKKQAINDIAETAQILEQMVQSVLQGNPCTDISFPESLELAGQGSSAQKKTQPNGTADSVITDAAANNGEAGQESSMGNLEISLPDNVDEDIFREFITDQPDVLENLEAAIMGAEAEPSEENRLKVKGILHNLKGESGLMGLEEMSKLCHECESLLENDEEAFPAEKLLAAKDSLANALNALVESAATENGGSAETTGTTEQVNSAVETGEEMGAAKAEVAAEAECCEADITIAENDIPLVRDFIQESSEHLESAENDLLTIEGNPEDNEALNAIFRAFHTIKGVAGFLNLTQISSLAHTAENMLDKARKKELLLEGTRIDVIFESIDASKQMLSDIQQAIENHTAVKPYPDLNRLISHIKACTDAEPTESRIGDILMEQGSVKASQVRQAVREQKSDANEHKIGEVMIEKGTASKEQVDRALKQQKAGTDSTGSARKKSGNKKLANETTVKVTTSRLDSLINMVGELVIAQSMVSQDIGEHARSNQKLERNVRHLHKITRDLQELSMSMRMVPVQGVFQKMARLVRDLSRKGGKEIEFVVSGAETELDRNMVEAIADPLVHMIRNSVDHGIDFPDEREKNGKKRTGKIQLRAFHQGGNIVIEISDDGRGLNREKILKKALANGIVKEGQELSDQEVYRLIFHAGLSTAEKVTDVSGRGVGMDVVRKNIESLRGRVDIDSKPGEGSIFSIRLPLTLAVIDGQVVNVGSEKFILPIVSIEQNLRPTADQISTVQGGRGEMMMIRGQLLPMIRIYELFDVVPDKTDPTEALIVVVTDGENRCCVLVDDLLGQEQVVIKSLGEYLGNITGLSGGAIRGDGNVSLILDVPGLITLANRHTKSPAKTDTNSESQSETDSESETDAADESKLVSAAE